jgi:hypothetical protein
MTGLKRSLDSIKPKINEIRIITNNSSIILSSPLNDKYGS